MVTKKIVETEIRSYKNETQNWNENQNITYTKKIILWKA